MRCGEVRCGEVSDSVHKENYSIDKPGHDNPWDSLSWCHPWRLGREVDDNFARYILNPNHWRPIWTDTLVDHFKTTPVGLNRVIATETVIQPSVFCVICDLVHVAVTSAWPTSHALQQSVTRHPFKSSQMNRRPDCYKPCDYIYQPSMQSRYFGRISRRARFTIHAKCHKIASRKPLGWKEGETEEKEHFVYMYVYGS